MRAYAWYLEGGYRFSTVMWSPTLTYRYAQFSGDSTPGDVTDRSYDPLFFGSGLRAAGPGTWYLGEIYGQYLGPPSNLNVHQVHLRASPTDTLNVGLIYYLADFNKPGQYGVSRSGAFHEIDVYAEWAPRPWLSVTPTFGAAIPRGGYRDLAQASVTANALPASTRTDRTIYLDQAALSGQVLPALPSPGAPRLTSPHHASPRLPNLAGPGRAPSNLASPASPGRAVTAAAGRRRPGLG